MLDSNLKCYERSYGILGNLWCCTAPFLTLPISELLTCCCVKYFMLYTNFHAHLCEQYTNKVKNL